MEFTPEEHINRVELAVRTIRESVVRGFPLVFNKKGRSIMMKYGAVAIPFEIKELRPVSPDEKWMSVSLSFQGLDVVIAEVNISSGNVKLYPEKIPLALRVVEGVINQHTADMWHIRLREYPKAVLKERLEKGFILKELELTRDIIVEKEGIVFAWINSLTGRPDFCYKEQIENGIRDWKSDEIEYILTYLSKRFM